MRGPQQALLRSDFASLRSLSLVCLTLLNSKSQVLFPIHGEPDPTHPTLLLLLLLLLLLSRFSSVRLCATPWTAAYQASPSMGFSRKEHWSGLPFPSPTTPTYSEPKLGLFRRRNSSSWSRSQHRRALRADRKWFWQFFFIREGSEGGCGTAPDGSEDWDTVAAAP